MHDKTAYRLEAKPFGRGGQAEVFRAVRKDDGEELVFKRRSSGSEAAKKRMRREIEVQRQLATRNRHVMPVLDWDDKASSWYVMPRGSKSMASLATPIDHATLVEIVRAVLSALEVAHAADQPHRDVKPDNVIWLPDEDGGGRWVLGDWGITRRPLGATTSPLTQVGQLIGTDGYAPPEAYMNGHEVGAPGDLYALGQLIGWALNGAEPTRNVSPKVAGPWRALVKRLTQFDISQRHQSCDQVVAALELMDSNLQVAEIDRLLEAGDRPSLVKACVLAAERPEDHDLLLDRIAPLEGVAKSLVRKHRSEVMELVHAMDGAFATFGSRGFDYANTPLRFLHRLAVEAAASADYDLLEDICNVLFPREAGWDRFAQRDITVAWLRGLSGEAAQTVAHCILGAPKMNKYLSRVAGQLSGPIGSALSAPPGR